MKANDERGVRLATFFINDDLAKGSAIEVLVQVS